jgi:hypothetical protein
LDEITNKPRIHRGLTKSPVSAARQVGNGLVLDPCNATAMSARVIAINSGFEAISASVDSRNGRVYCPA